MSSIDHETGPQRMHESSRIAARQKRTTSPFSFRGRSSRMEFFAVLAVASCISVLISAPLNDVVFGGYSAAMSQIVAMGVILLLCAAATFATTCRRLHDIGLSGWTQLAIAIPVVGILLLLCLYLIPGDKEANRYGKPP